MNISQKAIITAYDKGYRVINGQVNYKGRVLSCFKDKMNYLSFKVRNEAGKSVSIRVHRLVAYQKFGEDIFKEGIQVRHFDGNSLNNLDTNILIGTASQNHMDKKEEVRKTVAGNASRKHAHEDIIKLHKDGHSYGEIMEIYNISSKGTLSFIINKSLAQIAGNDPANHSFGDCLSRQP